jgi:hypothetical protein
LVVCFADGAWAGISFRRFGKENDGGSDQRFIVQGNPAGHGSDVAAAATWGSEKEAGDHEENLQAHQGSLSVT